MAKEKEIKDPATAISEKLSNAPENTVEGDPSAPKAVEPAPAIDLTKLTGDQLQQLKSMLNATPDSVRNQKKNPVVALRRYQGFKQDGSEFGGIIVDYQNAYNTLVKNEETNITSEVLMMKVKFLGDENFTAIPWKEFMNADQISCEVLSTRQVKGSYSEGEVVSKESGRLMERTVTTVQDFFTVKLPEGTNPPTIEIEGRIANA